MYQFYFKSSEINENVIMFLARQFSKKTSRYCHSPVGGVLSAALCENFDIF